jgi:glyoxylase-like metal-dependent hydrolase (beta-lactamase superfamily II)
VKIPETQELGSGVYRITMPLPFPDPQSVNCYLFEGDTGLTLLDCGVDGSPEFDLLGSALRSFGFSIGDLHRLIASHLHVDHMGMAARIIAATGCDWMMHSSTGKEVAHYNDWGPRRDRLARVAEVGGAPAEAVARFRRATTRPDWFGTAVEPTRPVEDGDLIRLGPNWSLEVLYTPGHQANHLCLRDLRSGKLYSGDHILPRISPFIPYTGEESDHLSAYLASLQRIVKLDAEVTYPGHGPPIERGSVRAHQIELHHARRLGTMVQVLEEGPHTPWEVMGRVFRPNLDPLEERLAFQETMAHLEYLRNLGKVARAWIDDAWTYSAPRT